LLTKREELLLRMVLALP